MNQATPSSKEFGAFSDAAKYAHENGLDDTCIEAVRKAAIELSKKRSQDRMTWVFAEAPRPFMVAVGKHSIYAFSESGMFLHRSDTSGQKATYTKNKFGTIEGISVQGQVMADPLPQKNALAFIAQLDLIEVPRIDLGHAEYERLEIGHLSEQALGALMQRLQSADINFEIEADDLIVEFASAGATSLILREFRTEETRGAAVATSNLISTSATRAEPERSKQPQNTTNPSRFSDAMDFVKREALSQEFNRAVQRADRELRHLPFQATILWGFARNPEAFLVLVDKNLYHFTADSTSKTNADSGSAISHTTGPFNKIELIEAGDWRLQEPFPQSQIQKIVEFLETTERPEKTPDTIRNPSESASHLKETSPTAEERIRRLIQMHEDGLITDVELGDRRREILREI